METATTCHGRRWARHDSSGTCALQHRRLNDGFCGTYVAIKAVTQWWPPRTAAAGRLIVPGADAPRRIDGNTRFKHYWVQRAKGDFMSMLDCPGGSVLTGICLSGGQGGESCAFPSAVGGAWRGRSR